MKDLSSIPTKDLIRAFSDRTEQIDAELRRAGAIMERIGKMEMEMNELVEELRKRDVT